MIITKKLQWVDEYLQPVSHLVSLDRITRISCRSPSKTQDQSSHGVTYCKSRSKYYKITIFTKYQSVKFHQLAEKSCEFTLKIKPFSKMDILSILAHELAHTVHWDHTIQHKLLQLAIYEIFLIRLNKSGYKSEEDEDLNKDYIM